MVQIEARNSIVPYSQVNFERKGRLILRRCEVFLRAHNASYKRDEGGGYYLEEERPRA